MQTIYREMRADAFPKIKAGQITTDNQMDNPIDPIERYQLENR